MPTRPNPGIGRARHANRRHATCQRSNCQRSNCQHSNCQHSNWLTARLSLVTAAMAAAALLVVFEAPAFADDLDSLLDTSTTPLLGDQSLAHRGHDGPDRRSCASRCGADTCPLDRTRVAEEARGCGSRSWRWRKARWHRSRWHRGGWRGWRAGRRLALGYSTGLVRTGDDEHLRDRGLFARFRLSYRLSAELELGGAGRHHHRRGGNRGERARSDNDRRDYHIGGGLVALAMPWARLSPYLRASAGMLESDFADTGTRVRQRYGEVGIGLSLRLGRRFRLEGDIRAGKRRIHDDLESGAVDLPIDTKERYSRARLNAVIHF